MSDQLQGKTILPGGGANPIPPRRAEQTVAIDPGPEASTLVRLARRG